MSESRLRERLHFYNLDVYEFAVLSAMCSHDWYGRTVWASVPRLAAYSKLSERKVQYLIRALRKRGILSELAPGSSADHRTVTYQINEEAFEADPRMSPYLDTQLQLPGIRRPAVPGEPISPTPGASHAPAPQTDFHKAKKTAAEGCIPCTPLVHIVRPPGAYYAPDSLNESLLESNPTPKPPATAFQDWIEQYLRAADYSTEREVQVPDRGDGQCGRIDLVARRGEQVVAIECDDERPRRKSETKLRAFTEATQRLIVLREPAGGFREAASLDTQIRAPCISASAKATPIPTAPE
jgi:hypothetical protein